MLVTCSTGPAEQRYKHQSLTAPVARTVSKLLLPAKALDTPHQCHRYAVGHVSCVSRSKITVGCQRLQRRVRPAAPCMRGFGTQVFAQQSPPSNWHCGMFRSASQKPFMVRVVPPAGMISGHGPPAQH